MAIIQSVSAIELVKLIKNQKVKLVDIRERDEYATGNIVDSVNIPSSEFDVDKFESLQEEHIVIYCLSGKRCINVMEKLKNVPNKTFYKLDGGINAWKTLGAEISGVKVKFRLMQQIFMMIGVIILLGLGLGFCYNKMFFYLTGFMGFGLVFSAVTGFCGMAKMFSFMPWNNGLSKEAKCLAGKLSSIERQVMFTSGFLVLMGFLLSLYFNVNFIYLSGFMGLGLFFAGITGFCGMATLLMFMPWHKK